MEEKIDLIEIFQKVDFRIIIRDVFRQWWMILMLSLSVAMIADVVINETYVPQYTSSTTMYVTSRGVNNSVYTDISTTSSLAEELSYILSTNVMERKVMKDLGLEELNAEVTVTQLPETNMLTITVTADTALNAYRVINSMLENYDSVTEYALTDAAIDIIQAPQVPTSPSNSMNEKSRLEKIFAIAVLIFVLLVVVASLMRDTVKGEREFSEKVDAHLLGVINHEKKGKRFQKRKDRNRDSMLITNPLRSFPYVEAYKMAASRIRSRAERSEKKVLLVTSVIENEGKSTVAANIALALAQERKNVVLIDCDFRKPAQYKIFEIPGKTLQNVPDILKTGEHLDSLFSRDESSGLYTIFNASAGSSIENIGENSGFRKLLRFCREEMDFVIFDAAPMAMVAETEELAQLSDATILVVRQDMVMTRDINDVIDVLNNTNAKVMGCIFNDAAKKVFAAHGTYGGHYGYGYGGHYGKRA